MNRIKRYFSRMPVQEPPASCGTQGGFTLIELLLYTAIVGTLLITITGFFALTAESRLKNQSISEVNQQGTAVMETITQSIRNASSITAPAAGVTSASLTLAMPVAGVNPTIFDLSGGTVGTMQIKEGTGAVLGLTSAKVEISGLTFRNLSRPGTPGVVQVSFTVTRISQSIKSEYEYQKTFISTAALR